MSILESIFGSDSSSSDDISNTDATNIGLNVKIDGGSDTAGDDANFSELSDAEMQQMYPGNSKGYTQVQKWNPFKDNKILGLPLYYNSLADPNGRVYNNTILEGLSYLSIVPGRGTVNKKLIDATGNTLSPIALAKNLMGYENDPGGLLKFGVKGVSSGSDLRFIGFKPAYSEYFKYVQTMLSMIYSFLDTHGVFNVFRFSDVFSNTIFNYGLCYYLDKSTSISESANNDYGTSKVAEMANSQNQTAREANIIAKDTFKNKVARAISTLKTLDPTEMMNSFTSYDGILTRAGNSLFRVVNGSQLYFPEIWQDSSFSRSYNINFKFYSPYGDKMSIFKYVYVPFISLLALALPCQDGLLGYSEPFYVKMSAPGYFNVDLGVINSLTFTKGGSDDLWTTDNLPQCIEVSASVTELYPQLVGTKNYGNLAYNLGMSNFLQNMVGLRPDNLNYLLESKALVNRLISNSPLFNVGSNISNKVGDMLYELTSTTSAMFK